MNFSRSMSIAALAAFVALSAHAETNVVLRPITVRGEQERDLFEYPSSPSASLEISASELGREEIELQDAKTLTDALKYMPGAHTETRGRKVKQFTSFRGQLYPYPDYAIDGIWQREFHELPYVFPASALERVEVQRSGAAVMNGLSDIEGVINIVPRRFEEQTTILDAEYGTHNYIRSSLVNGDAFERSRYTVGASHTSTDGPGGRNAAERIESVFGSGAYQATSELKLEGYMFGLTGQREVMKPDPDGPAAASFKKRTEEYDPLEAYSAGMRALYRASEKASTELKSSYTRRSFDYERRDWRPTSSTEEDYEYGLQLTQSLKVLPNNTLRFSGLYNHWVAPDGKRFYYGSRQDRETVAAVVADEISLDRLVLDGAVRYAGTYNHRYGGTSFNITGDKRNLEPVKDEWDDPVTVMTFGSKYLLSESAGLYCHIAGGQHQPAAGALTADGSEPDNEKRAMADAGFSAQNNIGRIKIGGFAALRDDVSVLSNNSATNAVGDEFYFSENENIQQYGVELETESQPIGDIVSLFFNATVMNSRKEQADGGYTDYKEIPSVILGSGLYTLLDRWDMNLFGKYVSGYENRRFAGDDRYHDLGDYLDLGATVGYRLGAQEKTRLYCSVENMLDDEYSTVVGWSDDGARFYAGIQHQF